MKKIDLHIHIGQDPFITVEGKKITGRDVTVQNLIQDMDRNEIDKAVVLALDFPGHKVDDDYVLEASKKLKQRLIPCACVDPLKCEDFGAEEVDRLGEFKLIKLMCPYQYFYPDDERLLPFYQECVKHKKALIFHTGTTDYPLAKLKYADPLRIDTVAVDFPKLKILMAHSGDPWFREAADVVIKNPNVYADVSGIILGTDPSRGKENLVRFFSKYLEFFPEDKIAYGSDWPYTRLDDYSEVIGSYPFKSKEMLKKLCYKNAENFLEL